MRNYSAKMENNLVSIILPVFNSEVYIEQCVNSVLNQEYKYWELIIVDDCSTDSSFILCEAYSKMYDNIFLFKQSVNSGAGASRNLGLSFARGDFITFIDSDDLWDSDKLLAQIQFMKLNNCPISFHSYRLVNETGHDCNKIIHAVEKIEYYSYLKNTIIGLSTSMINLQITGKFMFSTMRTRQDTLLWLTFLKRGLFALGMPKVHSSYRVRKDSISSNKFLAAKKVWELYYDNQKLGLFNSIYFFIFYVFNAIKKRL